MLTPISGGRKKKSELKLIPATSFAHGNRPVIAVPIKAEPKAQPVPVAETLAITPPPVPVPASTPEPTATKPASPLARGPKAGLGISIKGIVNKSPEEKVAEETKQRNPSELAADDFTQAELESAWKEFAEQVRERLKESFFSTMTIRQPQRLDGHRILYRIDNSVQKMDFEREQSELMEFLRTKLNNFSLILDLEINKTQEKTNFYTDSDKLNAMAERNPIVKDLVKKLGLDTEF